MYGLTIQYPGKIVSSEVLSKDGERVYLKAKTSKDGALSVIDSKEETYMVNTTYLEGGTDIRVHAAYYTLKPVILQVHEAGQAHSIEPLSTIS